MSLDELHELLVIRKLAERAAVHLQRGNYAAAESSVLSVIAALDAAIQQPVSRTPESAPVPHKLA
jgi:hypothetical protein